LNYRSNSYKTDFIIKISSAKDITNNRVVIVFHYNENGDRSYHRYAHITSKSVNNIKLSELIVKYVNDIKSKSMIDFRDLIGDIQDNDFPFSPHCGVLDDGISTYTYVYQLGDLTLDKDTIDVLENRVNTIF